MSGCGGGLSGAVSKGTEEEVADCRQECEEPSQGDEERLQSEENNKLLINSKQNGLTWILASAGADPTPSPYSQLCTLAAHRSCERAAVLSPHQAQENPTDPWNQDGPMPLTVILSPWDFQWEEMLMEVLPLSDRSPGPHPADLTTGVLTAKLIQVALNLLPCPVSAPPDTVWVYTAEPPAPAPNPMHISNFLLHSAAVTEDLLKSLEGLRYPEGRRASGDPEILLCNRTTLGSPGNMRQLDQGTGCRKRQGSSLPILRNESEGGYRPSLLRANNPGKATTPNTYGLDTPIKPRMAQPAFRLQSLQDPGSLLHVRAQIYTRLGGSEPESEDPGRKGLLPFLCPRPVRTLKVLAPLDGGYEERGMKLASRGSCPLKPIASWPTSSASRERKQWRSKTWSRALPVRKGGSEGNSSNSQSSQTSLDLEEQTEIFGMLLDQQEHEDAGDTVTGESSERGLPPSFTDDCNTSRPNPGAGAPNNNQDENEQIMGDIIHDIYHTGWMDDSTVVPRGAETESSHSAAPVPPGKKQNHCDVDLATHPGLSCEEEAWGDPDKAKYSEVLTKDDSAEEWHSNLKVPERSKNSHVTACDDEAQLACSVPETKQHVRSVNTALNTGQLNEENRKCSKTVNNRDRDRCSSYHSNQSFNVLAHKEHNPRSTKSKRNTVTPSQKPANARRPSDLAIGGKSILEFGPQGAKVSGKNTLLPSLWDKRVEPLRKNVTQSSDDRKNLIRLEGTGQREPVQLEPRKARQPKRSGMLRAPRAKSVMECVTYNDMFLEINSQGEGPAIYEMFATPVYEKLRASTSYQRVVYREMKCAPARRNQGPKTSTYLKPPEIKPRKSRREKSISTDAKQKRREDKMPRGKSHQVLISDTELESTISISDLDCHIQTTKAEMIFCAEDKKSNPRVTPEEHAGKRALSVIEEVLTNSLAETSTFHCTPKDKSVPQSADVLIRPLKESFMPQITSYCSLRTHHIVQEPDENGLTVKIGEEKLAVTARSDEPRSGSFTAQPKIDYWTSGDSSRMASPVFEKLLDAADEGAMTDDLLRCLAEELISLEEGEDKGPPETSDSCKEEILLASLIKKGVTSLGGTCNISGSRTDDTILWTKGEVLGKGAYGTVYCGLTSHGQLIAVKQVALDDTDPIIAKKEYQRLQDEVDLLKNLCHTNIVGFLGTSLQHNVVSIFMEYVPGGSIASILQRFGPLPERVLGLYALQILQGVAYLHANRVIHRDLKGNNVMLMPTGTVKLIDFGCARRLSQLTHSTDHSELLKSVHGTPYWMAPEVINETGHGRKSDVWSVGCTVFEMATGKPPLANMNKMAALFYIGARKGLMPALPDRFSKEAQDFVQACLTRDQKERPSAQQLLTHPFVFRRSREGVPQPQS